MVGDGNSNNEYNPFEMSLGVSSGDKTRRSSFSAMLEAPTEGPTKSNEFDLVSSTTLANGRKRALSSPAITTPGGSSFPFLLSSSTTQIPSGAMPNLAIKPQKRPRMSVVSQGSALSDWRIPSAGHSDASPDSSEVPTPPDSYLTHDAVKAPSPLGQSNDIDVSAANNDIFTKLQQQRQFLLAVGQPSLSQPQPLPLGPIPTEIHAQNDSTASTMPLLTRSASKKGKNQARASPTPSSADASPAPQPKTKRANGGGRKKSLSQQQKKLEEAQLQQEEDGDLSEDSLKRKQFLERNRVAACKSRQKKKEKVGKLEQGECLYYHDQTRVTRVLIQCLSETDATDLCQKNQLLQAAALALRQEILTLRQIIQTHDGCSCEHAQGYLQRDKEGRGIALLDNLAGRTMHLDYSVAPEMGSTDDVYSYLEDYARNGTVQEAFGHGVAPPNSQAMMPITDAPMPNIASAPSFTPSVSAPSPSKIHSRRQSDTSLFQNSTSNGGIFTRSAAAQQPQFQPPAFNYDSIASIQPQNHFGLTYDSNASNQMSLAPVATVDPSAQALLGNVAPAPALPRRQSSAPPTTPSWQNLNAKQTSNDGGDYFSYTSANNA